MKTEFKKGDIVYWQDLKGEVISIEPDIDSYNYPIKVEFTNVLIEFFTKDGRYAEDTPPVISHTPYTLNGFTQNSVIEKDTLVWIRDGNGYDWVQRFYSHFENGKHYCFANQLPSNETKEIFSWNYLETENPLLKKLTPKNK